MSLKFKKSRVGGFPLSPPQPPMVEKITMVGQEKTVSARNSKFGRKLSHSISTLCVHSNFKNFKFENFEILNFESKF